MGERSRASCGLGGRRDRFENQCVCVRACVRACVCACVSPSVFLHIYNTIGLVIFAVENICGLTY